MSNPLPNSEETVKLALGLRFVVPKMGLEPM